jgi:hypothetical protein
MISYEERRLLIYKLEERPPFWAAFPPGAEEASVPAVIEAD